MKKNVNINDFLKKFNEEYSILYNADCQNTIVAGYYDAVHEFDERCENSESFCKFVGEFVKYRGDFISSDREAAAFMFTLVSMTEKIIL